MKKIIATILAVIYLGTSTGATVHLHYCMGKLVNWGLLPEKEDNCNKCGMSKEEKKLAKGCCKDEQKQVKLKTDHKSTESFQQFQLSSVTIPVVHFEWTAINLPSITEKKPQSHAPPRSGTIDVYIRNCSFRI